MTTAVLYDHNYELTHTVEEKDVVDSNVLAGTLTIPLDHPAAQWLFNQANDGPERAVFAVLRDSVSQWRGRLMQWEIRKRGACPECGHCQQNVLTTKWILPLR
ncbi:hypothetical protein [Nocardia fusca]|uniref:Uncharacterized protein n=1 Tax=Nocardia fusca TaxID=941183 RepID=A0ABV3FIL6_9NOCA